jgi:hypothetical protein
MFQRVLFLLLVFALFLQGMGFCSCQDDPCSRDPAGHERRPHFHLCMVGLHHHDQKDHHADQSGEPTGHKGQTLGQQAPAEGHTDDAVYVSALATLGWHSLSSTFASGYNSALVPMDATVGSPLTTAVAALLRHSLPFLSCHYCPIYLRTLALLI